MSDVDLKSYLFVIDSSTMSRDDAIRIINKVREVENWQTILPDAAVLVSRLNIQDLQRILHDRLGAQRYLLTLLERGKKSGWLARDSWTFINKPTSVFDA